ncbi:MAG: DUF2442 domain-containing protein [Caldilineaceae bacterium]|nr:DUF2442 domain-containing protein [Caldilineaceae bacterium]
MNIALAELLDNELNQTEIDEVRIDDDSLTVDLSDGRTIVAPILWYPRLAYATQSERQQFETHRNVIFWPHLDEEVSVRGMLLGRKSGESPQSLQRWLSAREAVVAA